MVKLGGLQKRKMQDWRQEEPRCAAQDGDTHVRKPLCWETKHTEKGDGKGHPEY